MIEVGKKYMLKKIKGIKNFDTNYYKVIKFYNSDVVICENAYGERSLFMKEFLIDPDKPDEVYSDLKLDER